MIRSLFVIVLAGATSVVVYAQDETNPRAIVDRAIKAHGGEAAMAKHTGMTMKGSGTYYGAGEGIPYDGAWVLQGHTQRSFTIESKVNNMTFKFQRVVNGDKGWIKLNEAATTPMSKDELAEEKEQLFAGWVGRLAPLKDKSFTLTLIGEAKAGEKPVVGVRVSKNGHRDVNLYFDKQTGLLLKSETTLKDFMAGGVEYIQTTIMQEHKEVMGVKYASKILIQKDGKRLVEAEMSEIQPAEKLDDSHFKQP